MLKVLLVGGGNIAGGFDAGRPPRAPPLTHAGAYRAHGGFELAACVEPDGERRAAFMQRWGIPQGHACLQDVQGRFDVVSICSPTRAHHADLLASARFSPRVVFCEKPLCASVPEAAQAVAHMREAGIALAVNHNRRWDPAVTELRDALAGGRWGALRAATGHYNKGILNNGSHLLDLLAFVLGPLELLHAGAALHDHWPDDPSVPALLRTAAGAPVGLNCGHAADYALFELQLVLEGAVIAMEDGGMRWRVRQPGPSPEFAGYRALDAGEVRPGRYLETMTRAVQNIADAAAHAAPLASTGESALAAQRLCERIRQRAEPPPTET